MKTLSEIRELFVGARNLAKEASPARVKDASDMIKEISDHCKELYESSESIRERVRCRNLYESIDNVRLIMAQYGFTADVVLGFFGLLVTDAFPGFEAICEGRGTILKPKCVSSASSYVQAPTLPEGGAQPVISEIPVTAASQPATIGGQSDLPLPPPPPPAPAKEPELVAEPEPTAKPEPIAEPVSADCSETPSGDADNTPDSPSRPADPLEPRSLDEFIGQERVIKIIKRELNSARMEGRRYLDNILLTGNQGLGKSTLMELIAKELGVRYAFLDCTTLANNAESHKSFNEFFINIAKSEEPVVIALDEIHALTPRLQSVLLTLLQKRVFTVLGKDGIAKSMPIKEFTFIGATTDHQELLGTIRDRCSYLTLRLEPYSRAELMRIFDVKFRAVGLSASPEAIQLCINRCRGSLRDAVGIVKSCKSEALSCGTNVITAKIVEDMFSAVGVDPIGLKVEDLAILRALADEPSGFLSEDTLAARAGFKDAKQMSSNEPYLLRQGLINITSRGRTLTAKADEYLKYGCFDFGDGVVIGSRPTATPSPEVVAETPTASPSDIETAVEAPAQEPLPSGEEDKSEPVFSLLGGTGNGGEE